LPVRPHRFLLALVVILAGTAHAEESLPPSPIRTPDGFVLGGIAWMFSDELDLVGTMRAEVPLAPGSGVGLAPYVAIDARTAIEKTISGLTFEVDSLDYRLEMGARRRLASHGIVVVFLGQRGRENVDADGQPWVRYVGVGFAEHHLHRARIDWSAQVGAIVQEREVDGDLYVRGDVRMSSCRDVLPCVGFDLDVDGLVSSRRSQLDVGAGPRLYVDADGASLFLHYLRSRNPLGLEVSGLQLGFDFAGALRATEAPPVRVGGAIGGGAGDSRRAARFELRFATPRIAGPFWAAAEVDANVLTAEDTGELYYNYDIGLERSAGRLLAGAYYYHRSNHQLAEPNDTVTSFDVIEAGVETSGWASPAPARSKRSWGSLDARARLGYVIDTSFDEDRRWHARCGARWWIPSGGSRVSPFVAVEAEAGDVARKSYALGASMPLGVDVRIEYRSDDAYFGRDRTALLFVTTLRF
jgi:hypothetical protein